MLNKYICIHAHFYQPPRENPWTQEIEIQESAEPYKNWNKRVTEECYSPNASARILDKDSRIKKIINNYLQENFYSKILFVLKYKLLALLKIFCQ